MGVCVYISIPTWHWFFFLYDLINEKRDIRDWVARCWWSPLSASPPTFIGRWRSYQQEEWLGKWTAWRCPQKTDDRPAALRCGCRQRRETLFLFFVLLSIPFLLITGRALEGWRLQERGGNFFLFCFRVITRQRRQVKSRWIAAAGYAGLRTCCFSIGPLGCLCCCVISSLVCFITSHIWWYIKGITDGHTLLSSTWVNVGGNFPFIARQVFGSYESRLPVQQQHPRARLWELL